MAGVYDEGSGNIACYWVGTERKDLEDPVGIESNARCITVASDGSVYVGGTYFDGANTVACYWKDQVKIEDFVDSMVPETITVTSDGTVYVTSDKSYWKNGVKQDDFTPSVDEYDNCVTVAADGAVYYGGQYSTDGGNTFMACYWKGDDSPMHFTTDDSDARYIAVVGGTVYAAGPNYDNGPTCSWAGSSNQKVLINPTGGGVYPNAVTGSGSTAYVAGAYTDAEYNNVACYWVNGAHKSLGLPEGAAQSEAIGIAVLGGVAFVAGYYGSPPDSKKACCWVGGGQPISLPCPDDAVSSTAYGVYVK